MFVVTKVSDYLEVVECYQNLNDAQDRMIELACEDCDIIPPDFEELEKECLDSGTIDAMFIDLGALNSPVYRIDECEVL